METIKVQHRSGKEFEVEVYKHIEPNFQRMKLMAFDTIVEPKIAQGYKSLDISSFSLKGETKKLLENFFERKIDSKKTLYLVLTDESYAAIEKLKTDFDNEVAEWKKGYNARAEQMPVHYEMYDFLDWGDYSINREREIRVYRKPLPEDKIEYVPVKSYKFWNDFLKSDELIKEWDEDFKNAGGTSEKHYVLISNEVAKKWIDRHSEIDQELEKEKEEKARIRKEKELAEENRRAECFAKAKETGKPVVLYSIFLSGNDIPRRFRDEDSDMGNLVTYAMPDGSVKEEFSHAY